MMLINCSIIAPFFRWLGLGNSIPDENENSDMKYLIVGLGNIGAEYDGTRHNVGFDVVDTMAKNANTTFKIDTLGSVTEYKTKGRSITLLKPNTYMNRSGKAVNYWMQKLKINQSQLLIILDDLNLDFGKLRLRGDGSDGGHNGLKDINAVLGNQKYARLRVGIGSDFRKGQQVNFVLGKWDSVERENLNQILEHAAKSAEAFATLQLKYAMEITNSFKI
ncbi:MAG TPA: aminoacyl-tRNA hydrolase [Saprospiraceae bacterium]|nr:aminoacyl-tRNA hydrolase [Saprospiraceae bacterium]HPQ21521.1 aminoacyl-tRNA hydrolase [Saprospiraceae bacterium]